jgi:peptide deformylase
MSVDPASLRLRAYPDPVLKSKALALETVTDLVRDVASAMLDIMDAEEGIGIAAPQVGVPWRLFVLDVPEDKDRSAQADPPEATDGPMVFINPVLKLEGPVEVFEEGCLSLPGIRGDVLRPPVVTVTAMDASGKVFTLRAGGLLARCIQHEFDHLEGVLIIDKMTQPSRMKNRQNIRDLEDGARIY